MDGVNDKPIETLTVKELQDLCKRKGLKGYSGKKKAELLLMLGARCGAGAEAVTSVIIKTPSPSPAAQQPKAAPASSSNLPLTPPSLPLLGFVKEAEELLRWLSQPPSVAVIYGPSGIGKTLFAHTFFTALNYSVIEINSVDDEIIHESSVDSRRIALLDDVEKFSKLPSKKSPLTHLLVIMRDKPTSAGTALVLKVNRHSTPSLLRWLVAKFPNAVEEDLRDLCEKNNGDVRHILITLSSAFPGADKKDEILEKDAWSAVGTIYSGSGGSGGTSRSFVSRMEHALIDLDMILCLIADGLPKVSGEGSSLESLVDAYEHLSMTDTMRHQDGRAAGVVCVIGKVKEALPEAKSPFVPFPAWYGKYSKTEKQKKWIADWRRRCQIAGSDSVVLETLGLWRTTLLHRVGELDLEGLSEKDAISLCAKYVLKEMGRMRLDYDDVFEKYPEMLLDGAEIEELDERVVKEVKRLSGGI